MRGSISQREKSALKDFDIFIRGRLARDDMRWPDVGRAAFNRLNLRAPEADHEVVRTMVSNATMSDAIDSLFNSELLAGFTAEPDSTTGWTREISAANFLPTELFALATGARLQRLSRGDTAEEAAIDFGKSSYQIARFARQLTIDEQDMVDGQSIGASLFAVRQLGAEARRVRPDLVYSLILANGATGYDNTALFHADHANLGAAVMGTGGLGGGMAAIGNQTLTDERGDAIHCNNRPGVLIVPPDLTETARRTVRNIALNDGHDLEVRAESRIGAAGLVDPSDDETVRTGTPTNWLLACRAAVSPAIVVAGLAGSLQPTLRQYELSEGRFGFGWDIKLDIGVAAVDHRPVYWSTGEGE